MDETSVQRLSRFQQRGIRVCLKSTVERQSVEVGRERKKMVFVDLACTSFTLITLISGAFLPESFVLLLFSAFYGDATIKQLFPWWNLWGMWLLVFITGGGIKCVILRKSCRKKECKVLSYSMKKDRQPPTRCGLSPRERFKISLIQAGKVKD